MSKQTALEYKIPTHLIIQLPKEFWLKMFYNLKNKFTDIKDFDLEYVSDVASTIGWSSALHDTCKNMGILWFYEYWDSLDWWQSDMLDDYLATEIIKKIRQGE